MKKILYSIASLCCVLQLNAQEVITSDSTVVLSEPLQNDSTPAYGGAFKQGDVDASVDFITEFGQNNPSFGVQAQGEYGILPYLGVAVYVGNTAVTKTIESENVSDGFPSKYEIHTNMFSAGAKVLYHFGYIIKQLPRNMDFYGGIGLGVVSTSVVFENFEGESYNNLFEDTKTSDFNAGLNVGYKYYVTETIGFNAEVFAAYNGYVTGQIGVNVKF